MVLPVLAGALVVAAPVAAQSFSVGYKFLEAVRKRDGQAATDMLNQPGSTVVNTRDVTSGETGMHIATARRDLTWMGFLAQKGANVNVRDARGVTPLVLASNIGFSDGVSLLIGKGARVDEPNSAGETPLIAAVHRRDTGMMRLLLQAGADPDRADNSGRSARDYAKLDTKSAVLLSEIETSAKPKSQRARTGKTYGPSF